MAKYLVVPDVSRVAREMTEMSQVKMILSRWLRLGWREKAGVVVNNLKNWRGLVGREFATGVSLLAEMELLAQKADEPRNEVMVLHQQMVDMALALGNKMIIKKFVRLGKDYHIKVCLETNNPEFLVKRLAEWGGEEVAVYLPTMPESVSWKSWQKISPIKFEVMENKKEPKRFGDLLDRYLAWSKNRPVGKIPSKVAKEGAGESRIPFAHLANYLPVYILLAEKLIERDRKRRLRIGDIGCGSGRNISFVKEVTSRSNDEYFGVDYSRACINLAKKKYGDMGVEFRSYGGKRLPFPDSYFDWVVSSHVLEHIRKRGAANYFSEISRVLKN